MWHDSSVDEQIEIERLRKQILKVFHPYISVSSIQNIRSDGNYGFRAVALGLGPSKDQWPRIRSDLVRELEACHQKYTYVFRTIGYEKIYSTVKFVGRWMEMPDTSLVIASVYNKVVVNISEVGGCNTSFPFWSRPPQSDSHETIGGDHGRGSSGAVGFVVCVARETGQLPSVFWKGSLTQTQALHLAIETMPSRCVGFQFLFTADILRLLIRSCQKLCYNRFSSLPLHILSAWNFMSQDAKRCHPLAMVHNSNMNGST
nr:hypothetical protein [Tanacetum cinerariifolium]